MRNIQLSTITQIVWKIMLKKGTLITFDENRSKTISVTI